MSIATSNETTPAPPAQPTMTELVSGILNDAQTLIRQQLDMLRVEFKEDLRRTKDAVKYIGVGIGLLTVGTLFLTISLVFLLKWLVPQLPDWACWAIVGGVITGLGVAAVYAGKRIFDSFNPLPDKSMHALQENVTWLTNHQK